MRRAHRAAGAAENRAEARPGEQEDAGQREHDAENGRAARADRERDEPLEGLAEPAAVVGAERQLEADERDRQAEPERADVDEPALAHDQGTERHEDDRREICGRPDPAAHEVGDGPTAEPEPEDRRQEDAEPGEAEPDQLRVVMAARLLPLDLGAAFLDPRRSLRGRPVDPLGARHAVPFAAGPPPPPSFGLKAEARAAEDVGVSALRSLPVLVALICGCSVAGLSVGELIFSHPAPKPALVVPPSLRPR